MHPHHPMKPFAIPTDWSAAQAMAVIDLLDELRCHIWQRYEITLLETYRELYGADSDTDRLNPTDEFIDDLVDF
jgi:hypothetical protein